MINEPYVGARWMHEVLVKEDSDNLEDSPAEFKFGAKRKTDEEGRQLAKRRTERQRDSIHQFNYQVSKEREQLLEEHAEEASDDDAAKRYPPGISTQAYT